ncbi:MAG TPA: hypothetical protein PLU43_07255, partial [Lachnospiraceae bacterium]|nr:hypothetical protein [Lachnospiraceae bacterium]
MGERHQKRNVGLLICVIVLCIAVVCLAVWLIKDRMHGKESFEDVILNLEFDDKEDLYWVENISSKELLRMQKNGHIHFDSDGPREFILKYRIKGGELVHYRVRNAESGPSFFAGLSYGTAGSKSEMQQIRFIPNSFSPVSCIYMVDFMDGGEPLGSWEGEFQGSAIMNTGQWHDVIYYLPEDADSVYVILSDEEQDKIAYLSFVLPEDWRHEDWQLMLNPFFDEGVSGQSVDLDFVRVSDSTLSDYLKNHISSYQTHKERLDQFLAKGADQIPVLSNQEQEETTGDESQAREEEADEQNGG